MRVESGGRQVEGPLSSIRLSDIERDGSGLTSDRVADAVGLFRQNGYLRINNLFAPSTMAAWQAFYNRRYRHQLAKTDQDDSRPLYTVEIEGPLNTPTLYANPKIFPIIQALLGEDCILGAMSTVISFPGAPDQFVHRDSQALFEKDYSVDVKIPPYALTLLIPLVDCTTKTGCTKVRPATHLLNGEEESRQPEWVNPEVEVGSVMLTDSRVIHRGGANLSQLVRPLIYLTYHRKWYRDFWGYERRPPVNISRREFSKMPEEHRNLVVWTRDPYRWLRIKGLLTQSFPGPLRRLIKRVLGR